MFELVNHEDALGKLSSSYHCPGGRGRYRTFGFASTATDNKCFAWGRRGLVPLDCPVVAAAAAAAATAAYGHVFWEVRSRVPL